MLLDSRVHAPQVFPAHAGMFQVTFLVVDPVAEFSPRTRGCSVWGEVGCRGGDVFPAHAGMFPLTRVSMFALVSFPRARGDVPPPDPR